MVAEYLAGRGYNILEAGNIMELKAMLKRHTPHLIILDVDMPGGSGLTALRDLRSQSLLPQSVAVIMLTASSDVIDRIIGLEMGADDYICKPADLREIEARIRASLRRHDTILEEVRSEETPKGIVEFGICKLDLDRAKLIDSDGGDVPITVMEFNILKVFAENKGKVLNRDQLLEQAHDKEWEPFDRSIDLRISRIRKKIEVNHAKPETIRTVHGIGYIFD